MDLRDFILEHENDDTASLVLHRERWPEIDLALAAQCIASRRKLRFKVPEWYALPSVICPLSLSAEQCSSSATAAYKAGLASGARAKRIADLTGGLGVDSWQFSKQADAVLYNEMNPLLVDAARDNLKALSCSNVEFSSLQIGAENLPALLEGFRPDLVFMDPARRGEGGRKVFLPEECTPDVLTLQDIILDRGIRMLVKLSPMADISLLLRKFHCVKELHIVEAGGECKELLLLMEAGFDAEPEMVVTIVDTADGPRSLRFHPSEEKDAAPLFIASAPEAGQLLFEPGAALSKSGAFNLISKLGKLQKCGPNAHLYCGHSHTAALDPFGKFFEILAVEPFGKASMKDYAKRWPDAEISARALPVSSDNLRVKMKLKGGGDVHIFALGCSCDRLLIATSRLTRAPR